MFLTLHIFKKLLLNAGNYVEMQVSKFYNTVKKGRHFDVLRENKCSIILPLMKHRLLKSKFKSKSCSNAFNIL